MLCSPVRTVKAQRTPRVDQDRTVDANVATAVTLRLLGAEAASDEVHDRLAGPCEREGEAPAGTTGPVALGRRPVGTKPHSSYRVHFRCLSPSYKCYQTPPDLLPSGRRLPGIAIQVLTWHHHGHGLTHAGTRLGNGTQLPAPPPGQGATSAPVQVSILTQVSSHTVPPRVLHCV